jgi:hypothetical protein
LQQRLIAEQLSLKFLDKQVLCVHVFITHQASNRFTLKS